MDKRSYWTELASPSISAHGAAMKIIESRALLPDRYVGLVRPSSYNPQDGDSNGHTLPPLEVEGRRTALTPVIPEIPQGI